MSVLDWYGDVIQNTFKYNNGMVGQEKPNQCLQIMYPTPLINNTSKCYMTVSNELVVCSI